MAGGCYGDPPARAERPPNIVATDTSTEMVRALVSDSPHCGILNMRPLIDATCSGGAVASAPFLPKQPPLALTVV